MTGSLGCNRANEVTSSTDHGFDENLRRNPTSGPIEPQERRSAAQPKARIPPESPLTLANLFTLGDAVVDRGCCRTHATARTPTLTG